MAKFHHDIIEQDGQELDLNQAFDAVMNIYGPQGDVVYVFMCAVTKKERRAYRFEISGENIIKEDG